MNARCPRCDRAACEVPAAHKQCDEETSDAALERLGRATRECRKHPAVDWRARAEEWREKYNVEHGKALQFSTALELIGSIVPGECFAGPNKEIDPRSVYAQVWKIAANHGEQISGSFWRRMAESFGFDAPPAANVGGVRSMSLFQAMTELADIVDKTSAFVERPGELRAILLKAQRLVNVYRGRT